jgi:hypothetical protein
MCDRHPFRKKYIDVRQTLADEGGGLRQRQLLIQQGDFLNEFFEFRRELHVEGFSQGECLSRLLA